MSQLVRLVYYQIDHRLQIYNFDNRFTSDVPQHVLVFKLLSDTNGQLLGTLVGVIDGLQHVSAVSIVIYRNLMSWLAINVI